MNWTNYRFHQRAWVADTVAVIPPLLVFVCQTLPRLIKQRRERIVIAANDLEKAQISH
jgi:hypothetical protein